MDESQVMKLMDKLSELSERMARVEALLQERSSDTEKINAIIAGHEARLSNLEQNRAAVMGVKSLIGWAAMAAIALYEAVK